MSFTLIPLETFTNEDFDDGFMLVDDDGPVDLTGSEFIAHIREAADTLAVVLECSTDNGMLVIADQGATGETGLVEWSIPEDVARTIPDGVYHYDVVWIMPGGKRDTTHGGTITFYRGITRTP